MASSPNTYMHTNKQKQSGATDSGRNPCVHHTASVLLLLLLFYYFKIFYLFIYNYFIYLFLMVSSCRW
jgi:hypothetical protein